MYKLETENFLLELLPGVHQDNFPYPKANSLQVKVSSLGFSADSIMDIDDIALSDFAVNLNELYETLSGSVRLEEPYSMHCFLEFTAVTGGHIRIKGRVHNKKGIGYGHVQNHAVSDEKRWSISVYVLQKGCRSMFI